VRVRERREIGADGAELAKDGEDLSRVVHRCLDLCLVADHAGVAFRCRDLGLRHGGDPRRVEVVERHPDAVPLFLNDLPDPGLEDRSRQVLEEERGIVRCMVAELIEWRRQRIGCGGVPGLYPRDERRRLVVGDGEGPQRASGVLQLAIVDAAQDNRVQSYGKGRVWIMSLAHADPAAAEAWPAVTADVVLDPRSRCSPSAAVTRPDLAHLRAVTNAPGAARSRLPRRGVSQPT